MSSKSIPNKTHLKLVLRGADAIRTWKRRNPGKKLLLQRASLQYLDLQDADLRGGNLRESEIVNVNLSRARLEGVDMRFARFESCNLWDARISRESILFPSFARKSAGLPSALPWPTKARMYQAGEIVAEYAFEYATAKVVSEYGKADYPESPVSKVSEAWKGNKPVLDKIGGIQFVHPMAMKMLQKDVQRLKMLTPRQLEELVAQIFLSRGFNVTLLQYSKDRGLDVLASSRDTAATQIDYGIQVKQIRGKVGQPVLNELIGAIDRLGHNAPKVTCLVTTSSFTRDAVRDARERRLRLIDGEELEKLLQECEAVRSEYTVSYESSVHIEYCGDSNRSGRHLR